MTTNTMGYNGFGTRVSKTDSGGSFSFMRNGTGVTAPVLSDGFANYTPGISDRRNGATKHLSADITNTTQQMDASQTIAANKQYDAFGNLTSSTGTWNGPFSYGGPYGYQSDPDTSLHLLGHRYYDSTTGGFLTRDPSKNDRNWYIYCGGSPTSRVDPTGYQVDRPSPSPVDPLPDDPKWWSGYYFAAKHAVIRGVFSLSRIPLLGAVVGAAQASIGVAQLVKWRKAYDAVCDVYTQGDPEATDPRQYGLPQWWPMGELGPSDDRLNEVRSAFYRARGSDPAQLRLFAEPLV